jgi:hypothetical protein
MLPRNLVLIALAALAFTAAGCGSKAATPSVAQVATTTTTSTNGTQSSSSQRDNGRRFSACMRSHGVTKFPDPSSDGGINIRTGPGMNPASPLFQAAQRACQKLMPRPKNVSPAAAAKAQAAMLKFSACMRAHGLKDFPDPTFSGGMVQLGIKKSAGLNPSSPIFQAAQKACQSNMPKPPGATTQSSGGKAEGPGGGVSIAP